MRLGRLKQQKPLLRWPAFRLKTDYGTFQTQQNCNHSTATFNIVVHTPVSRQRPWNKQGVEALLCNRQISSHFWATARRVAHTHIVISSSACGDGIVEGGWCSSKMSCHLFSGAWLPALCSPALGSAWGSRLVSPCFADVAAILCFILLCCRWMNCLVPY
jgi:hypothetical protein